jgi:hypothetical protein
VAAAFSPDAATTTMLVGVSGGGIFTIPTNQLLVNPLFSTTQGSGNHNWTSIAWSGDGSTVFACGSNTMQPIYSTTGGTFWSNITVLPTISGWASVSPNSNGFYALFGAPRIQLPTITIGPVGSWTASTTGIINANITNGNRTTCASSQTGDIQIAIVSPTSLYGVYSSYNYGSTWIQVGGGQTTDYRSTEFTCAAVSSNGFVETVLGFNSSLAVKIATASGTMTASTIPIALNAVSATSNVGGNNSTGFSVVPSLKGISGAGVFGWRTPTAAPVLFPQINNGPYSTAVNNYQSGWGGYPSSSDGTSAYFLFDTQYPIAVTGSSFYGPPNQLNGTVLGLVYTPGSTYDTYVISNSEGYDLTPGTYTLSLAFASGSQAYTVYVPLKPPTNVTAVGKNGSNITVTWEFGSSLYAVRTHNVYCNAVLVPGATGIGGSTATVPNTGSRTINIYVTASANGIQSVSAAAATLFTPAAPTGLSVTQWSGATGADANGNLPIQLSWTTDPGLNYYALSSLGDAYTSPIGVNVKSPTVGNSLTYTLWAYSNTATSLANALFSASAKITITSTVSSRAFTAGTITNYSIPALSILKSIELLGAGGNGAAGDGAGRGGGGGGGAGAVTIKDLPFSQSTSTQAWNGTVAAGGSRANTILDTVAYATAGSNADAANGIGGAGGTAPGGGTGSKGENRGQYTTESGGDGGVGAGSGATKYGVFGFTGAGFAGRGSGQDGGEGLFGCGGGGGGGYSSSGGAGGTGRITFAYNQIT